MPVELNVYVLLRRNILLPIRGNFIYYLHAFSGDNSRMSANSLFANTTKAVKLSVLDKQRDYMNRILWHEQETKSGFLRIFIFE